MYRRHVGLLSWGLCYGESVRTWHLHPEPYIVLRAHGTCYLFSCHLGKVIRYDTVSKLGWSASARTHGIKVIIEKLLAEDWEPGDDGDEGQQVPALVEEDDCVVR